MITPTNVLEQPIDEIVALKAEKDKLLSKIDYLNGQLAWFQRQLFGQRSEKIIGPIGSEEQLFLLGLDNLPKEDIVDAKIIPEHTRKKYKKDSDKLSFPENLPIERIILDLSEEEKFCAETGKALLKIGEDVHQKLAHRPGSYYIKEIVRPKYAAPRNNEEGVIAAALPDSLLQKCKADESFLAEILVKKFADHLPLYRQSEILSREGIGLSRQLLSKWVIRCGIALKPLYNEMSRQVLSSNNVFADEVPVDMLKPGKGKVQQAYMWVLVGGKEANPAYRVYNFRTDRCHKNAEELLKGYHGILHSDKYGAYEKMACQKQFIWCPCWAHIRRKFVEAESGDLNFRNKVLRKIKYLFMFERVAWNRSEEWRLKIRQEKEIPIIDELIDLVKSMLITGDALPRSKFKEALGYFYSLIPYLKNYTQHAYARMDNNVAERAVRPLAIGRKNWLFLGNEEGGDAAAVILSLVQTCRSLKINPREYLEDVMCRIMSHNFQKLDELLPDKWIKKNSSN